jgi:Matrixin/Bacterial tandem repeat domain 1
MHLSLMSKFRKSKRTVFIVLSYLFTIVIASCSNQLQSANSSPASFEEFVRYETQRTPDEKYIIEGDIVVSTFEDVKAYYAQCFGAVSASQAQKSTVNFKNGNQWNIWDSQTRHNLTFCISNNFGVNKEYLKKVVLEAAEKWEFFADVEFKYISEQDVNAAPGNSNVNFYVRQVEPTDQWNRSWGATAPYPSTDNDRKMLINPDMFYLSTDEETEDPESERHEKLLHVLTHELGHILGLMHEHIWQLQSDGTYKQVSEFEYGTGALITDLDPYSVMAYSGKTGFFVYPSTTISELDIKGIQKLYGPNIARVAAFMTTEPLQYPYPTGSASVTNEKIILLKDGTSFQNMFNAYHTKYWVDSLNVNVQNGVIKYSAIFRKNAYQPLSSILLLNLNKTDFTAAYNSYYKQDYRIRTIDTFTYNGEDRYAAVMEFDANASFGGGPEEIAMIGVTEIDFITKHNDIYQTGWSEYTLNYNYETNTFTVIFRKNINTFEFRHISREELNATIPALNAQGISLLRLDSYVDAQGVDYYSGIYKATTVLDRPWLVGKELHEFVTYCKDNILKYKAQANYDDLKSNGCNIYLLNVY